MDLAVNYKFECSGSDGSSVSDIETITYMHILLDVLAVARRTIEIFDYRGDGFLIVDLKRAIAALDAQIR